MVVLRVVAVGGGRCAVVDGVGVGDQFREQLCGDDDPHTQEG